MSDRGALFLFSAVMFVGSVVVAIWLITTAQSLTFDDLLLICCCLVVAFAFWLYLKFLIRSALAQEQKKSKPSACAATEPEASKRLAS